MHEETHQATTQAWIENRLLLPGHDSKKDSVIMAKMINPAERRAWIQRIIDHDGVPGQEAGGFTVARVKVQPPTYVAKM
jgi:pyrroloquinoline-quinone synthase